MLRISKSFGTNLFFSISWEDPLYRLVELSTNAHKFVDVKINMMEVLLKER